MSRLPCIFRGHVWKFVRAIYGDEIIACGYKRNWYKCIWCGRQKATGDRPENELFPVAESEKGTK